jgi:hypothetical protein
VAAADRHISLRRAEYSGALLSTLAASADVSHKTFAWRCLREEQAIKTCGGMNATLRESLT